MRADRPRGDGQLGGRRGPRRGRDQRRIVRRVQPSCRYTAASRIGEPEGKTSPEELLAAAHGGCFTMSLAGELTKAGTPPERLDVRCVVTMDEVEGEGNAPDRPLGDRGARRRSRLRRGRVRAGGRGSRRAAARSRR